MSSSLLMESVLQVFKSTTLIQDIASFTIDPRPWLIVFGKSFSQNEFESKTKMYLNQLISFMGMGEIYIESRVTKMITVLHYKENPEISLEDVQNMTLQLQMIKSFLCNKPLSPEIVRMESNWIHLFNCFRFILDPSVKENKSALKYVSVKYFDFPKHYLVKYPYDIDDTFFDLGLHQKVFS